MTSTTEQTSGQTADVPVRKSITVKASPEHAFAVFTDDMDSWWPRDHHIGKSPMKRVIVEGKVGGRCYTQQMDGTDCDWGSVLTWDPPRRFVMAWRITTKWEYETDLWKSSEVEVSFTPLADGSTRVDLEHRHLARHGAGFEGMRGAVDSANGWTGTMARFAARVAETSPATSRSE
jgi:uncharacterized protein YndB with AHSA1/START domain